MRRVRSWWYERRGNHARRRAHLRAQAAKARRRRARRWIDLS